MLAWEAVTLTHRSGLAVLIKAVSEALALAEESVPDVELVAGAVAVGVGVGVGVLVDDPPLEVLGVLGEALGELVGLLVLGLGVGLVTAGGLGVEVPAGTLTVSHWLPDVETEARAGVAVKTPIPMAATPVTRSPPAARLVAAGRTRMKHIVDVLPVESAERPIRMSGYIWFQLLAYPYIRHHLGSRAPPLRG